MLFWLARGIASTCSVIGKAQKLTSLQECKSVVKKETTRYLLYADT